MIMGEIYSSFNQSEIEEIIELYHMNFDVKEIHFSTCRFKKYLKYTVLIIYQERRIKR